MGFFYAPRILSVHVRLSRLPDRYFEDLHQLIFKQDLFLAGRCGSRQEPGTLNSRGARQSLHAFATPLREPHLLPCSPRSVFPLRVQIPNWSENRIARKAWTEVRVDLPFCGSEGERFGFRSPDFKDLARPPEARVVTRCLNLTPLRTARDSSWFSHPFRAGRRLCLG